MMNDEDENDPRGVAFRLPNNETHPDFRENTLNAKDDAFLQKKSDVIIDKMKLVITLMAFMSRLQKLHQEEEMMNEILDRDLYTFCFDTSSDSETSSSDSSLWPSNFSLLTADEDFLMSSLGSSSNSSDSSLSSDSSDSSISSDSSDSSISSDSSDSSIFDSSSSDTSRYYMSFDSSFSDYLEEFDEVFEMDLVCNDLIYSNDKYSILLAAFSEKVGILIIELDSLLNERFNLLAIQQSEWNSIREAMQN
jgi:hypothetical protein